MNNRQFKEYTIWNAVAPQTVTSSTDATPVVITKSSHGYATGDVVLIYGHTTNVTANGIYKITKVNANSFSLQNFNTGANIAGSGAGAGSGGVMILAPKIVLAKDYSQAQLQISTTGSGNMTVKLAGSMGIDTETIHGDTPNFGGTVSATNPYSFIELIDLTNNNAVDGDTGVVASGTDISELYEINISAMKYLCLIPTAWSAGSITAKITLYYN